MPSLTIDGIPTPVTVDASFATLSPEQQSATVEEIKGAWAKQKAPAAPKPADVGTQLLQGAHDVYGSVRETARATGLSDGKTPAQPAPEAQVNPVSEVVDGVKNLDWSKVRDNALPALARTAAPVAAGLGGAALGGLVGGPIGALAGGAAASGLMSYGDNVNTVARNNNHVDAQGNLARTRGDHLQGGLASAIEAPLDALGSAGSRAVRGAVSKVAGREAAQAGTGLVSRAGTAAADAGLDAASSTVGNVAQQAATSVGTEKGLQVDPVEAAVGGVLEGGVRGGMTAPGAIAQGALETGARKAGEAALGDMTPERAAAVDRVMGAVERSRQASDNPDAPLENHINAVRVEVGGRVQTLLQRAQKAGWLDEGQYRDLARLHDVASTHNKALSEGEKSDSYIDAHGLATLEEMQLPVNFKDELRGLLMDEDVLASASRKKNLTGPFEKMGDLGGRVAAVGGGFAAGGPMGAAAGLAASLGANPLPARVGSYIGRSLDNALGTRAPAIALARGKAQQIVADAGMKAGDDTLQALKRVNAELDDPILSARIASDLPVDPDILSANAAQRIKRRMSKGLEVEPELLGQLNAKHQAEIAILQGERGEVAALQAKRDFERAEEQRKVRDAKAEERGRTLTERAADQISGIAYKAEKRAEAKDAVAAQKAAVGSSLKAPKQPSTPTPPAAPPAPPAPPAVQPAPSSATGSYLTRDQGGWAAGLRRFVQAKGLPAPTREQIAKAVDMLQDVGDVSDDEAAVIRSGKGTIHKHWLAGLTAAVGEQLGAPDIHSMPDVVLTAPAPAARVDAKGEPIRSVDAYDGVAAARQSYLDGALAHAREVGDEGLHMVLADFKLKGDSEMSPQAKVAVARAMLKSAPPKLKAKREAILLPLIGLYSKKKE